MTASTSIPVSCQKKVLPTWKSHRPNTKKRPSNFKSFPGFINTARRLILNKIRLYLRKNKKSSAHIWSMIGEYKRTWSKCLIRIFFFHLFFFPAQNFMPTVTYKYWCEREDNNNAETSSSTQSPGWRDRCHWSVQAKETDTRSITAAWRYLRHWRDEYVLYVKRISSKRAHYHQVSRATIVTALDGRHSTILKHGHRCRLSHGKSSWSSVR